VLGQALTKRGHLPTRKLLEIKDLEHLFQDEEDLVMDATEPPIQRPGDPQGQKDTYSGKKNATH